MVLSRMRVLRPLAALAVGAALVAPALAAAATAPKRFVFTFDGRGFGHGVGMPQYGAYGAALAGWDERRILGYYYPGTALSQIKGGAVRVLLATSRKQLPVSSPVAWQAVDESGPVPTAIALTPGLTYTLDAVGRTVRLRDPSGRQLAVFKGGQMRVQSQDGSGYVTLGGAPYRGAIRAIGGGGLLEAVNVVDLESYLQGVVPREMPSRWGDRAPAALRAQAIAARSYAVATLKSRGDFDLYPDERSQVYGGVRAEDPRTTAAVRATGGQVLTYAGKIITAFFFSSSGGRTEDVRNVFTSYGPAPYLVSVPDPFDILSPNHQWTNPPSYSGAQLGRLLGLGGTVKTFTVEQRGSSPRVMRALVVTTSGRRVEMSGTQVRRALTLRDTWFSVVRRPLTPATAGLLRPTPPVVPPAPPATVTAPATTTTAATTPTTPTTPATTTPAQPPAP